MPAPGHNPSPNIALVETPAGETTLYVDGDQAMQAWEQELMEFGADLVTAHGSRFLECGLGLGLSALRLAANAEQHTVVEVYPQVIELFEQRHPVVPPSLQVINDDFFDVIERLDSESIDGIFFDPALEKAARDDAAFLSNVGAEMYRVLRPGGSLVPFFSTRLEFWEHFAPHFERLEIHRRPYRAYATTNYCLGGNEGVAWVHRYVKDPRGVAA